jgi:hypothetical protein
MKKIIVGRFFRGRPSFAPILVHSRTCALVADGWVPPVSSCFPQSPPLLRPIPTAGVIPSKPRREHLAKAASCRPVPSSRYWLMIVGCTITSPPLHRRLSTAPLCHRCMVEMPPRGARQRGLAQSTLLTEVALPNGCRLGPGVALSACMCGHLGAVQTMNQGLFIPLDAE